MGRKSAKGKEKKMKRKEEQAKIAAAKKLVDAANSLEDPMESLAAFKKFERNGLTLNVECQKVSNLEKDTTDWVFNLTKTNMKSLYESSDWGWKEREKKEELLDDQARYLLAKTIDGELVGFCHFRFDLDFDDEVIYCYEIQLTEDVRRKGLGKFLMQILQLLAFTNKMKKVMVTVFKDNKVASNFFRNVLNFKTDETCPSYYDSTNENDYCYEILSKPVQVKSAATPTKPIEKQTTASEVIHCCHKC